MDINHAIVEEKLYVVFLVSRGNSSQKSEKSWNRRKSSKTGILPCIDCIMGTESILKNLPTNQSTIYPKLYLIFFK